MGKLTIARNAGHLLTCYFSAGRAGLGQHVWAITIQDVVTMRKVSKLSSVKSLAHHSQSKPDSLLIHLHLHRPTPHNQVLDPHVLPQHSPHAMASLDLHGNLRGLGNLIHHRLLSLLQPTILLLDPVRKHRGRKMRDQPIRHIHRKRRNQYLFRFPCPGCSYPDHLEIADEDCTENSCY